MGSVPPVLSMRMSAQKSPVSTCTEATRWRCTLISFLANHERFLLTTAVSFTSMTVGNRRLPRVQRLAANLSTGMAVHRTRVWAQAGAARALD